MRSPASRPPMDRLPPGRGTQDAVRAARSGTLAGWRLSLVLTATTSGVTLTAAVKRTRKGGA